MNTELEIVKFDVKDIVTISPINPCGDHNDLPDQCDVD